MSLILERIAGVVTETEPRVRQEGRVVVATSLVAVVTASALGIAYVALGSRADAFLCVPSALGGVFMLGTWRVTRRTIAMMHVTLAWYSVLFLGAALLVGDVAYLAWLAVIPLAAFFIGGLRVGLGWSAVALGGAALGGGLMLSLGLASTTSGPAAVLRVFSLPPTIAALGALFELARKKSVDEVDVARVAALRASEAKGQLLARVNHEIRTPLNGVLGLTQSLLMQPLPDEAHRDLDLIRQSGAGLLALINDLLDIARAEAGKLELHPTTVDLHRLLHDTVGLYRASAEARGLELVLDGLSPGPLWVRVDEIRLRQVIGNLVANAVKFTERGSVTVRLARGREADGLMQVALSVEDTGRGIPPEGLDRLFEPFTQIHADPSHRGSGLGLALSRDLATRLGGQLSAASTVGSGSVFTLMLTVERAAPPAMERMLTPAPLPPFRALVVDDNELNRKVARALLVRLGARIEDAADGRAGAEAALAGSFDIVFMDLQMPELDGYEATRLLRTRGFKGAILALTASSGPETESLCLAAGMNGCLTKPLQLEQLRNRIEDVLRPRSAASPALPLSAPGERTLESTHPKRP